MLSRAKIASLFTIVALGTLAAVALASGSGGATDPGAVQTRDDQPEVRTQVVRQTIHRRAKSSVVTSASRRDRSRSSAHVASHGRHGVGEVGDDHGRHGVGEAGDDHGRHHGTDDRGADDHGGHGDDDGPGHDAFDDHGGGDRSGHGGGGDNSGHGGGNSGHGGGDD